MNKLVFEANLMRFDGSIYGTQILSCDTEEEALLLASRCAKNWSAPVQLYQVPYVKDSDEAWQAEDIRFVAHVERAASPRIAPHVEPGQRIALRERAAQAVRKLFSGAGRSGRPPHLPTAPPTARG